MDKKKEKKIHVDKYATTDDNTKEGMCLTCRRPLGKNKNKCQVCLRIKREKAKMNSRGKPKSWVKSNIERMKDTVEVKE